MITLFLQISSLIGVIIDNHITWKHHTQEVKTFVSKYIDVMHRIKSFVPKSVLLVLYKTMILPHLHYCAIVCLSVFSKLSLSASEKRD